jgi:hypothetical protein
MNPTTFDPHHLVPEVSPEDAWGEDQDFHTADAGCGTILPPRRLPSEGTPGSTPASGSEGIRIEASPRRLREEDMEGGLDVRQIDGSVVRLDPEIPSQPRVARQVVFHEQTLMKPRGIEVVEWGRSKRHSTKWILALGLGVGAVVVMALVLQPRINRGASPVPHALAAEIPQEGDALVEDLINRQSEAERLFGKFISAPLADDVLPLVRDRDAVELLIRARPLVPVAVPAFTGRDNLWDVQTTGGGSFGVLEGSLPDFSKFRTYFTLADGLLQIDWEASTAYGTATFEELEKGRGNPAEIRGIIQVAGYYSPAFPESGFVSYLFAAPNQERAVWCYSRRGDAVDQALGVLLQGGEIVKADQAPRRVTLRLERGPVEAFPNQWLVGEVLHEEWIHP